MGAPSMFKNNADYLVKNRKIKLFTSVFSVWYLVFGVWFEKQDSISAGDFTKQ
jgi:hypothetical protein